MIAITRMMTAARVYWQYIIQTGNVIINNAHIINHLKTISIYIVITENVICVFRKHNIQSLYN